MSLSLPTNEPTSDRSLNQFSDEAIANYIYTKYRDDNHKIKIDVENYIALVDRIIKIADQIALTVSRVGNFYMGTKGHLIFSDDFFNVNVVDPPVCILHQISNELACKDPGKEKAHQTTMNILEILVSYSWEAKALLTLTAFAAEYGDIWHLYHYSLLLDPLAKSLAMIKRVPFLKRKLNTIKYQQVLLNPSSLIYGCLQAIKYMNQIKKLSSKYDVKEQVSESSSVLLPQIPFVSYWVIHMVVAAQIQVSSYLNDTEGQPQKYLNELSEKISFILSMLESHLNITREQQTG